MSRFSPRLAVQLAFSAYQTLEEQITADRFGTPLVRQYVDFHSLASGRTGIGFIHRESGFAALGIGKGPHQGDAVIAIRGTQLSSLIDWHTNLNVGLSVCDNGHSIHSGFSQTFASLRPHFQRFLDVWRTLPGIRGALHCVGHSLGGALAVLAADWAVGAGYGRRVYLYTFGAPRVGLAGFAQANTGRVLANHRCIHAADPVTLVPLWPFVHSPIQGVEYRLDRGHGLSPLAHLMDPRSGAVPGYLASADTNDWGAFYKSFHGEPHPVHLRYEDRHQASFSDDWCDRLAAALITILKETGYYAAVVAQASLGVGATFYDMLAATLESIAKAGDVAAHLVRGLLGHMLVFAGAACSAVTDLGQRTIRRIFDLMLERLYGAVREALRRPHPPK